MDFSILVFQLFKNSKSLRFKVIKNKNNSRKSVYSKDIKNIIP